MNSIKMGLIGVGPRPFLAGICFAWGVVMVRRLDRNSFGQTQALTAARLGLDSHKIGLP